MDSNKSLLDIQHDDLVGFLSTYNNKPWRKHSFYRGLKSYFKWQSLTYEIHNPFFDKHGNVLIEAPKTPNKILYTLNPNGVRILIEAASGSRNKAIIALLADSGVRKTELVNIQVEDLNLDSRRIIVMGKGRKEGWLVFGQETKNLLETYISEAKPTNSLFGLKAQGLRMMLTRLERRTGIKCNPHSFRRGFATELRRQGFSELDIMELGRWSSVSMVQRYTKAFGFENAASKYESII